MGRGGVKRVIPQPKASLRGVESTPHRGLASLYAPISTIFYLILIKLTDFTKKKESEESSSDKDIFTSLLIPVFVVFNVV